MECGPPAGPPADADVRPARAAVEVWRGPEEIPRPTGAPGSLRPKPIGPGGGSGCSPVLPASQEKEAPPVPKYERRRIAVPLSFITQEALDGGRAEGSSLTLTDALRSSLRRRACSRWRALSALWVDCYSFRSLRYSLDSLSILARFVRRVKAFRGIFAPRRREAVLKNSRRAWSLF